MDIVTAFTIWLQSQNIPVAGCESKDGVRITRIDYAPSATPEQKAAAETAKANFAPQPLPDITGFIKAINSDPLVSGQPLLFQLGSNLLPIFQNDMMTSNLVALQQHWADAKKIFGATWLTPKVQQMISGYAVTYKIPLE